MQPPEGPPVCAALNFLPPGMPPPISSTIVAQRGAHGDLHQAGIRDLAAQGKDLGALAGVSVPMAANQSAPCQDDLGDVGVGLHVVEHGGLAEQALDRRERRAGPGLAPVALDGASSARSPRRRRRRRRPGGSPGRSQSRSRRCSRPAGRTPGPARWRSPAACTAMGYSART